MLYIDIGNSRVKIRGDGGWAVVAETQPLDALEARLRARGKDCERPEESERAFGVSVCDGAIDAVESFLGRAVKWVGRDVALPMPLAVEAPAQVGADRVLNAFAAWTRAGGAAVAVGCGTAITFDVASEAGEFMGGCILPGLRLGATVLYEHTERLPLVSPVLPETFPPGTTETSISAGLLLGAAGAISRLIAEAAARCGAPRLVVLTGGDAAAISPLVPDAHAVVADLTLEGLRLAVARSAAGR